MAGSGLASGIVSSEGCRRAVPCAGGRTGPDATPALAGTFSGRRRPVSATTVTFGDEMRSREGAYGAGSVSATSRMNSFSALVTKRSRC